MRSISSSCVPLLPRPPSSPYQAVSPQTGLPSMSRSKQEIIFKSVFVRYTLTVLHHRDILQIPKFMSICTLEMCASVELLLDNRLVNRKM